MQLCSNQISIIIIISIISIMLHRGQLIQQKVNLIYVVAYLRPHTRSSAFFKRACMKHTGNFQCSMNKIIWYYITNELTETLGIPRYSLNISLVTLRFYWARSKAQFGSCRHRSKVKTNTEYCCLCNNISPRQNIVLWPTQKKESVSMQKKVCLHLWGNFSMEKIEMHTMHIKCFSTVILI